MERGRLAGSTSPTSGKLNAIREPHGFSHDRTGMKLPVAETIPEVSVNGITDEILLDSVTGNAAFSGQVVRLGT